MAVMLIISAGKMVVGIPGMVAGIDQSLDAKKIRFILNLLITLGLKLAKYQLRTTFWFSIFPMKQNCIEEIRLASLKLKFKSAHLT